MRRHLRILSLALALQGQRKVRFVIDCGVYFLVVFLLASVLIMTASLREEAEVLLSETPEIVVQRVKAGRHDWVPVDYGVRIAGIRGVETVTPRLWGYYYDPPTRGTYTVMGVRVIPESVASAMAGTGGRLEAPWDCVIGIGVARLRLVEEGDIIPVRSSLGELRVLRVKGVFSARSQLLTNDLVLLREEDWRNLFAVEPGVATDLVVRVPSPPEIDTVAAKILELLPDSRPITRELILKTYDALFDWRGSIVLLTLLGALVAFFILAWERASSIAGDEARMLGILRGVGWEVSDIIELKTWQGVSVSLFSFLLGTVAAHLHVFYLQCALFSPFLKGWSVLFPEFALKPAAESSQFLAVLLLTAAPYTLATLVPAWKAASTDPDRVMRG